MNDPLSGLISTGTYSTAADTSDSGALTIEKIMQAAAMIDAYEAEDRRQTIADMAAGLFNPWGPLRFKESTLATSAAPVRKHKRRRNQTDAYHRRVQKKWTKRFGTKLQPCVFQLDGGRFGMGSMLVVHPAIAARLRAIAPKPPFYLE